MTERPVTLITGSRTGIGKSLAEHFVSRGHQVVGCSRGAAGWSLGDYEHFEVDVADPDQAARLFSHIKKRHGRLDHLINNAGIASMNHFLLTPFPTVRRVLDTNVAGAFLFAQEAARLMRPRRYGRIVNFTTVAVPLKLEGEAIYAASKAAVISLTQILAKELAPMGITVNCLGPNPVETDLIKNVPKEKIARLISAQAIPRPATFADVANVVDFYLSPASGFVTGQTLFLGGV